MGLFKSTSIPKPKVRNINTGFIQDIEMQTSIGRGGLEKVLGSQTRERFLLMQKGIWASCAPGQC